MMSLSVAASTHCLKGSVWTRDSGQQVPVWMNAQNTRTTSSDIQTRCASSYSSLQDYYFSTFKIKVFSFVFAALLLSNHIFFMWSLCVYSSNDFLMSIINLTLTLLIFTLLASYMGIHNALHISNLQTIQSTILDIITPDDLRILVESIDEDSRRGNFQRMFPSLTSQKYLQYFDAQRYYNLLLQAWVLRYNRLEAKGSGRQNPAIIFSFFSQPSCLVSLANFTILLVMTITLYINEMMFQFLGIWIFTWLLPLKKLLFSVFKCFDWILSVITFICHNYKHSKHFLCTLKVNISTCNWIQSCK